jgi:hypothetical protein
MNDAPISNKLSSISTQFSPKLKDGTSSLNAARWFVEQQSQELPIGEPEQERSRQLEQQYRVSGGVRVGGEHSSVSELANGNSSGVPKKSPDLFLRCW